MDIKDKLMKALLKTKDAKPASGGSEIAVLCPRCHMYHIGSGPHLYIEANGEIIRIDCKHCSLNGLLSPGILHEIGIVNEEFDKYLNTINRGGIKKIKNSSDINNNIFIPTSPSKEDLIKIEYSSDRTKIDFSKPENIKNYKMVYNLNEFLKINNIVLTENKKYIDEISNTSIGFLSYNNNTINMRNLFSDKIKKRYINLKIDKTIKSPFLYIPPIEVDLLTPSPKIVAAEGTYDILCVKSRYYPSDCTNIMFGAVGSSGSYKRGIMKMMQMACYYGADITIYSDADVSLDDYRIAFKNDLLKLNAPPIKIIYNKLNKDHGNINESYALKKYILKRR